jgi:hypothetical protein
VRQGVGAFVLLLSITGCGTPAADSVPVCSQVWVVGQTLPKDYEGCDGSGADPLRVTSCGSKSGGRFVEYGEFNAVAGHSVHRGRTKAHLRQFLRDCS